MDKSEYMKDWWAENKDRRKEYEKKRSAKMSPEQREERKAYYKSWRLANIESVKVKDGAKYQRRKAIIAEQGRDSRVNNTAFELWKGAKSRAKRNGWDFDLVVEDIVVPERCPVFGIPLFVGEGSHTPNSPSLDRLDSTKGYVKGNVFVISHRANCIKRDATLEELRMVSAYVEVMANGPP